MITIHNLQHAIRVANVLHALAGRIDPVDNEAELLGDVVKVLTATVHTLSGVHANRFSDEAVRLLFEDQVKDALSKAEHALDDAIERLEDEMKP